MRLFKLGIKDIVDVIEGRINNKFDYLCVVDGSRGLGKSTFGVKVMHRVKCPIPFKARRDIVYEQKDVIRHIASKKGGCILVDEAVNVIYNRDFYSEGQKTLIKQINMYRDSNNIMILCVPSFADLDVQLRELCSMRITILRRGVGLVQVPKKSLYDKDIWNVKSNSVLEKKWSESKTKNPKYSQLSTAVGIITFGDLTTAQRNEYEAIKQEKRNRVFGEFTDQSMMNDPEQIFYKGLMDMMKAGKLNPNALEVASKVHGKDINNVRHRLNKMLKELGDTNRVRNYVVEPKKKVKRDALGFVVASGDGVEVE